MFFQFLACTIKKMHIERKGAGSDICISFVRLTQSVLLHKVQTHHPLSVFQCCFTTQTITGAFCCAVWYRRLRKNEMDLPVNLKLNNMQIQKPALTARKKKKKRGGDDDDKDLRTKYQTTQIKTHTVHVSALSSSFIIRRQTWQRMLCSPSHICSMQWLLLLHYRQPEKNIPQRARRPWAAEHLSLPCNPPFPPYPQFLVCDSHVNKAACILSCMSL